MILVELGAENFLKFRRISLKNLPAEGLIGIRGPNEAGKTSLGEAITFALFGRTLRLSGDNRWDAIRWGENATQVHLRLQGPHGEILEVSRSMDSTGGYGAELRCLTPGNLSVSDEEGQEEGDENQDYPVLLASGPGEVDEAVRQLLGFDFEAFRYAFYLGQKEIDLLISSAESGGTLERMIGVLDLERARVRALNELAERESRASELRLRHRLQEELVEELGRGDEELERNRGEEEETTQALHRLDQELDALETQLESSRSREAAVASLKTLTSTIKLVGMVRSLAGRICTLEEKSQRLSRESQEARKAEQDALHLQREHLMFSDSLKELEEFVRAKGQELTGGELATNSASESDSLSSEADLLQSLTRKQDGQLKEERGALVTMEQGLLRSRKFTHVALASGPLLGLLFWDPRWLLLLPVAAMGKVMLRLQEDRVQEAQNRIDQGQQDLRRLKDEIGEVRKVGKACDRFLTSNKAALLEGLRSIGSESLSRMARRLEERFPQFWKAPETFLEGYAGVLQEAVDQRKEFFDLSLAASRGAATAAESAKGRLESLFRLSGITRPESCRPFGGTQEEGLEDLVERDLVAAERLLMKLEGEKAGELPRQRSKILEVLSTLDPEEKLPRPDCEGIFRILRGKEPPGVARSEDPMTWAVRQVSIASAFIKRGEVPQEDLQDKIQELHRERDRFQVSLDLLMQRGESIAGASRIPEERLHLLETLQEELAVCEHDALVRAALAESLTAAVERLRTRLFPWIAEYAARLLPRITGGRHADVRISQDGELQFFAREAGEYVAIEALSGGARDQFLLALRLAFASAVVRARAAENSSFFLFLDEPLASSDEGRGRAFLELLEDRSESFRQVFVVTHRPAGDETYDMILRLSEGDEVLEVESASPVETLPVPTLAAEQNTGGVAPLLTME
jgi:DNA repair exonuclease SbcCD ATPase subunit